MQNSYPFSLGPEARKIGDALPFPATVSLDYLPATESFAGRLRLVVEVHADRRNDLVRWALGMWGHDNSEQIAAITAARVTEVLTQAGVIPSAPPEPDDNGPTDQSGPGPGAFDP